MKSSWSAYFSLFASSGTLLCCALPSLLVSIGMGAVMAGLVSSVPQLIWLSQYKGFVFSLSAASLAIAGYFQYRAQFEPCPADEELAKACTRARVWSLRVLILSVVIWTVGAFFAFAAQYVL